jgi:Protein of unknown function (DUF2690)
MRKSVLAPAALALIASSVLISPASRADAATTCSGTGCNGVPAGDTTCVNGAYVVDSENYYVGGTLAGNLQLKYSPSCRTTWGRVWTYIGNRGNATIQSTSKEKSSCNILVDGSAGCNTGMVYDANVTSYASALIYSADGLTSYTWHTISY